MTDKYTLGIEHLKMLDRVMLQAWAMGFSWLRINCHVTEYTVLDTSLVQGDAP